MTKRNQHYVWRYYLEAWQNRNGLVPFSINGKVRPPTNPKNIMVERDFYKLSRITTSDLIFLETFIEQAGLEMLKQSHRNLVNALARIANANELIQKSNRVTIAEKEDAKALAIETEEDLQGQIEVHALSLLKELRNRRTDFINVDETAISFYRFISHQYFRTKRIRESIGDALTKLYPNHDFARITNIMCHITAENVGCSLFRDRRDFDIVFLGNRDGIGFVTGDQPVVNLLGTEDGSDPKEIIFYYPLSPILSCILAPKECGLSTSDISSEITEQLNDLIAWHSRYFLVADSIGTLQRVLRRPSSTKLPAYHILDSLTER